MNFIFQRTLALVFLGSMAFSFFAQASNLTCTDLQTPEMDDKGNLTYVSTGTNIEIYPDASGVKGWVAKMISKEGTLVETDVEVQQILLKEESDLSELILFARPDIDIAKVETIDAATIGASANAEDGLGLSLFILKDAQGVVLGKVLLIGWGPARCAS